MEEPPPPAANPPDPPGGAYLEFREVVLGLYCDLDRCGLEVEVGNLSAAGRWCTVGGNAARWQSAD